MTSRISYSKLSRENRKRMLGMTIITVLTFFIKAVFLVMGVNECSSHTEVLRLFQPNMGMATKVFVSVTLIGILSAGTSWNKLTASLRSFHIPDIFIFTLDITLKYIAVLGEICMEILTSLRLRSVGQNRKKAQSFSGILGISFLKSREMAEEMYAAMCCRGFVGEYKTQKTSTFRKQDILSLLLMIGVTGIFIYFEGLWK